MCEEAASTFETASYENNSMFIHANVTGLIELSVIINMQYLPRVHIS